jgi:4-hydroxy-tetrahydrodipicolinate synthase
MCIQRHTMASDVRIISRNCTTFSTDGRFDEGAYRASLRRFASTRIDVYVASGGSGEANALTRDELRSIYRSAVDECKGTIAVNANIPEVRTAAEALELAAIAIDENVDLVNMYGPVSVHGYVPNDRELVAYFATVLEAISLPVAVAPNPIQGYEIKPALVADLVNHYEQVTTINLAGVRGDEYFLELVELLQRDVEINVPLLGSLQQLYLGATGVVSNLANVIPNTVRRFVDLFNAGELKELSTIYAQLDRFHRYCNTTAMRGPRWEKAALKVLRLPGGEGGVRPPYLLPPDEELERWARGLTTLGIPELEELARAAGLLAPTG